jgi:hypothetical protein
MKASAGKGLDKYRALSAANHNPLATHAQAIQAMPHQMTANLPPLMARAYSHGSNRNSRQRSLRGFDGHAAEQNMANDLAAEFGHQGKKHNSFFP